jgi:hypothetical protein
MRLTCFRAVELSTPIPQKTDTLGRSQGRFLGHLASHCRVKRNSLTLNISPFLPQSVVHSICTYPEQTPDRTSGVPIRGVRGTILSSRYELRNYLLLHWLAHCELQDRADEPFGGPIVYFLLYNPHQLVNDFAQVVGFPIVMA